MEGYKRSVLAHFTQTSRKQKNLANNQPFRRLDLVPVSLTVSHITVLIYFQIQWIQTWNFSIKAANQQDMFDLRLTNRGLLYEDEFKTFELVW